MTNKFRAADNLFTLLGLGDVLPQCVSAIAAEHGFVMISNLVCELQSNLHQAGKKDHLDAESCALSMVCSAFLQNSPHFFLKIRSYMYIAVEIRRTNLLRRG